MPLSNWFTAGPAANRLIDAGDGVVERKKDFVAVVKQPRAYNGIVRRDQNDRLATLPRVKNFHARTDAWPDEVDQDDVAIVNVGLVFFNHFDDTLLLAAAKVPQYNRITRVTFQSPLGILTPVFTFRISASEHRAAQVNDSVFVQSPLLFQAYLDGENSLPS